MSNLIEKIAEAVDYGYQTPEEMGVSAIKAIMNYAGTRGHGVSFEEWQVIGPFLERELIPYLK